jgi:hypothetical protein
LNIVLAQTT